MSFLAIVLAWTLTPPLTGKPSRLFRSLLRSSCVYACLFSRRSSFSPAQNMYCVIRGEKHFTLLPPSDVLFLYEQDFARGKYRRKLDGAGFDVQMEPGTISWIPVGKVNFQHLFSLFFQLLFFPIRQNYGEYNIFSCLFENMGESYEIVPWTTFQK